MQHSLQALKPIFRLLHLIKKLTFPFDLQRAPRYSKFFDVVLSSIASSNRSGSKIWHGRTTLSNCSRFINGKRTFETTIWNWAEKMGRIKCARWYACLLEFQSVFLLRSTHTSMSVFGLFLHHSWTALKICTSGAKNESRSNNAHSESCDNVLKLLDVSSSVELRSQNVIQTSLSVSKLYSRAASRIAQQFFCDKLFRKKVEIADSNASNPYWLAKPSESKMFSSFILFNDMQPDRGKTAEKNIVSLFEIQFFTKVDDNLTNQYKCNPATLWTLRAVHLAQFPVDLIRPNRRTTTHESTNCARQVWFCVRAIWLLQLWMWHPNTPHSYTIGSCAAKIRLCRGQKEKVKQTKEIDKIERN